jgi:hypothetical protein
MLPDELLDLGRVQELEIGLGDLARPSLVDDLVDDGHGRLGEDAHRRRDDLELVGPELLDRQERLVLPGQQHVAQAALHERGGRPTRARVEHRHVLEDPGHERAGLGLVATGLPEGVPHAAR